MKTKTIIISPNKSTEPYLKDVGKIHNWKTVRPGVVSGRLKQCPEIRRLENGKIEVTPRSQVGNNWKTEFYETVGEERK